MKVAFTKMNGAGNDFVLIDNRDRSLDLTREQVARLCDRRRGVGADGAMLLVPATDDRADWAWQFYNSDGGSAEMCGNGARCFARFIQHLTRPVGPITFQTIAGVIRAEFDGDMVTIGLTPPSAMEMDLTLASMEELGHVHFVNTGVPHVVVPVTDMEAVDVMGEGVAIRGHAHFKPAGTNVNFMSVYSPGRIRVRTCERGVPEETLACGTGVTACALVHARLGEVASPVQVRVQGGEVLEVGFRRDGDQFVDVTLKGPAEFNFTGEIEL